MTDRVADLLSFIDQSPTPYHAVATTCARLEAEGYEALDEADEWALAPGDRRYVVRAGGSVAAFEVGSQPASKAGFRIVGAHTDSPNLRIKPEADVKANGYHQLAVEPYGGVLLHTWMDRDLSLAGRVTLRDGKKGTQTVLVDFGSALLRVPNLAIHLFREIHTEGLKVNAQRHMVPLFGLGDTQSLDALLREEIASSGGKKVKKGDVLAYDLMAYDLQPGIRSGADGEFIHAARLDNLASSHAGLCALIDAGKVGKGGKTGKSAATRMVILYDHEEVGSRSAQGAGGTFLADLISRIATITEGSGKKADTSQSLARAVSQSWLISADMAHALHPNYADRHEPGHRPLIGAGPVIKTNSNQAYATDAETAGYFAALCAQVGVTPQNFVTRSDLGCGSTIGPISAARVGIRAVDVGNPMLSMHSIREMAGAGDVQPMIDVLGAFFGDS